jgi:hypothetical protein
MILVKQRRGKAGCVVQFSLGPPEMRCLKSDPWVSHQEVPTIADRLMREKQERHVEKHLIQTDGASRLAHK